MGSLDALMDVQKLDTRAHQVRHQKDALPQMVLLASARQERDGVQSKADAVAGRLHELRHRQKALEDDASLTEDKAADINAKLYDGSVTAHKELEAFQTDHRLLKARQSELEDEAIEVMEAAEPVQSELDALAAQVRDHDVAIAALTAEIEVARSELDVELVQIDVDRAAAAECVPAEVMSAYEVTRTQMGGIGAARLLGNRCEGCHLEIPSAELEAVRRAPEDAVVTCPECGRILVR